MVLESIKRALWVRYVVKQQANLHLREVSKMRMALTTSLSYWPVPLVALVGIAYIWVVNTLLGREQYPSVEIPSAKRAA